MNSNNLSKEMLFDLVVSHKKTIEQQANRIKELEKYVGFKDSGYDIISANAPRELSDEEIEKLATSKMNQILMDLLMPDVGNDRRIDWNTGCTKQHLIDFARAILKKAIEK
jgi:DNA-binding NarL/FixJ family response regulator